MLRKIQFSILILVLAIMSTVAYAEPDPDPNDGCYADASATIINEDESVTITIKCDSIDTSNNVFAFQVGTTRSGDFDASTVPSSYTAGTFAVSGTGATSPIIVATNMIDNLYSATRQGAEKVTTASFTLGEYTLTAEDNLTADGTITITLEDDDFMLSDDQGQELTNFLKSVNDVTITVTDIDLAWFTGDMIVSSDVTGISNLPAVELVLGDKTYNNEANVTGHSKTFTMDNTHQYSESGTPASDGTLNLSVSADMTGHLMCSDTLNAGDTGSETDIDSFIGSSGTITLLAGDADDDDQINNTDATLIGANLGNPTGEAKDIDINGDGTINVLDLSHVGRNYDTTTVPICGTGS